MGRESGVRDGEWLVALDVTLHGQCGSGFRPACAARLQKQRSAPHAGSSPNGSPPTRSEVDPQHRCRHRRRSRPRHRVVRRAGVARAARACRSRSGRADAGAGLARPRSRCGDRAARTARGLCRPRARPAGAGRVWRRPARRASRTSTLPLTCRGPTKQAIDRDAPETLTVPSGRSMRLEYAADGTVSVAVKLQELFGLAETPRLGPEEDAGHLSPARAQRAAGADPRRTSRASGPPPTRRSARNCADGIRAIRGPTIRGPRRRRTERRAVRDKKQEMRS